MTTTGIPVGVDQVEFEEGPTGGSGAFDPRSGRAGRAIILVLAGLYFLVPMAASFVFTVEDRTNGGVTFGAYADIPSTEGFTDALRRSLTLAVLTVVGALAVTIPAMLAVRLRLPRLRPIIEGLSLLPLVIPPIALVVGVRTVLGLGPNQLAGTPFGDALVSSQDSFWRCRSCIGRWTRASGRWICVRSSTPRAASAPAGPPWSSVCCCRTCAAPRSVWRFSPSRSYWASTRSPRSCSSTHCPPGS
jgi:hypothetical protein